MPQHFRRKFLRYLLLTAALFAIYSPSASAAEISNVHIENFKLNTARVYATVTGATTFKVEYGGTKLLELSSHTVSVSGSGAVPVSVELVGLRPLSTYHYRVSINSGTVKSSEAQFEMLKSWKVNGTRIEKLAAPAKFNDQYLGKAGEGGYIELRGPSAGGEVRLYCRQSAAVSGTLGVSYEHLEFNDACLGESNVTENVACTPISGIQLSLDANLMQKTGSIQLGGEGCPIGKTVSVSELGFSPPEEAEDPTLEGRFEGSAWVNGYEWVVNYRPRTANQLGAWKLIKPWTEAEFGVS
jgi:hypothetical protein